jgi:hypothetical protein
MSGFKIAFLILAHEHPQHLARLAASLEAPWSDIYVHINRSVDGAPFARATAAQRVTFVPDALRCTVHWSGFSLLEAMLALARYALEESAAERFCFLSVALSHQAVEAHPIGSRGSPGIPAGRPGAICVRHDVA